MKHLPIVFLIFLFLATPLFAAEIKNLKMGQTATKGYVTYDLYGKVGEKEAEVKVSVSINGEKYPAEKLTLSGDLGKGVKVGTGKRIWWDVFADLPAGLADGDLVWEVDVAGGVGAAGAVFTDPTTGMKFVGVPAGCFQMGDTFGGGDVDEKPVHEVCVSGFSIGKFEVTQRQYKTIMGSNPSHFSSCGDNCPVEKVSWNDAQQFIQRLNSQSGKRYRLPTEAEWEYAARSGGKQELYSGGEHVDSVAWYSGNSGSQTHPVGQKQANGLGIYDMSGNVWEWCGDWFGPYTGARQQNPAGASSGFYRVDRGGSWGDDARYVRSANRPGFVPGDRSGLLGFRLVLPSVQ